jgi:uncharacterized protein (TIGR00369 family)
VAKTLRGTETEPADPAYETRVRQSFAKQTVMATLGAALSRVAPGEIDIELPNRPALAQQHGFLHAGILATILDSACGYAAFTLMPADAAVLSVEFKINLLAPADGERFVARGRVIRSGRNVSVCQADAFAISPDGEKHVATMVGTMMCVRDREGLRG